MVVHRKLAKCSCLKKQWRGILCPKKTLHSHTFLLLDLQLISIIIATVTIYILIKSKVEEGLSELILCWNVVDRMVDAVFYFFCRS